MRVQPTSGRPAPAIVVRLELERRPVLFYDTPDRDDAARVADWVGADPACRALVADALALAGVADAKKQVVTTGVFAGRKLGDIVDQANGADWFRTRSRRPDPGWPPELRDAVRVLALELDAEEWAA